MSSQNQYPVSPLSANEFQQLVKFYEEDQLTNPEEHGLVILEHHQVHGSPFSLTPLTPEESDTLKDLKAWKDWCREGCGDWVGLVTEPEFKDDIPYLDEAVVKEEWDKWVKEVQEKERLLEAQARSPQSGGEYLIPRQDIHWGIDAWMNSLEDDSARLFLDGDWCRGFVETYPPWEDLAEARSQKIHLFCGSVILPEQRSHSVKLGRNKRFDILDAENKMVVQATVTHKGMNYHTARCDKGAIYIDLKYTSYLPKIGEGVTMIVRLKEADRACPFACVKVLHY